MDIFSFLQSPQTQAVFFIAELGINHDGDFNIAKKMIDAAVDASADAVKFQIYDLDYFYNQEKAPDAYNLFKKFAFTFEEFLSLKEYAHSKGILAFASPFDFGTLKRLIDEKIFPIKIASGDSLTEPWIDYVLKHDAPLLISGGSLEDIEIQKLSQKIKNTNSALLYCVSEYPAPAEGFDIRYIQTLQSYLPNQAIGFSDHSEGYSLTLAAVAQGAKIIERHFTLSPERTDFDHPLSLSPQQFSEMVQHSRIIEKALGKGQRICTHTEKVIRPLAGRDIYALKNIPAQQKITEDMIVLQRPGKGVTTQIFNKILSSHTTTEIPKGARILDYLS